LTTSGVKLKALLAVEGFCNRLAQKIIVPSKRIRDLLVLRQKVPAEKVQVVPYGFDFTANRYQLPTEAEVLQVRREMGLKDAFVIGNFGRHHQLKGQDYLLRAFAKFVREFPNARLLMVGQGPFNGELRRLAKKLGVCSKVLFTGWRHDAVRLMAGVDVVVHPTLLDSFPQVMIEALAFRKPLIITDAAGPADQIRHGRTGLIIPMRDYKAIQDSLKWVALHLQEAQQLGEGGRRYVLQELAIERVVRQYEEVYNEVLDKTLPSS